jgi:divalent metal cation (Fe/Co/Zn/Cd) transporter
LYPGRHSDRHDKTVPGVLGVGQVRLRWIGHRLRAECEVLVEPPRGSHQSAAPTMPS